MKHSIEESRGSHLARWACALSLAFGASSCVTTTYTEYDPRPSQSKKADLAVEIERLADDLAQRAELRIPLGVVRVVVDDPVPVRPESARFRPTEYDEPDRRAAQAAIRYELEMALGNRMNVVGASDLTDGLAAPASVSTQSLAARASRTRATHALLGTFVRDGDELDLSVRLVELDSEWIVATARRRIRGFAPHSFHEPLGAPVPAAAESEQPSHTALVTPFASDVVEPAPETDATSLFDPPAETDDTLEGLMGGAPLAVEPLVPAATESDELPPIEFDRGPAAARLRALGSKAEPLTDPDREQ
ncbi:MAG: hypothetical protein AAGA20_17765 [Planctomycetota bacterium]